MIHLDFTLEDTRLIATRTVDPCVVDDNLHPWKVTLADTVITGASMQKLTTDAEMQAILWLAVNDVDGPIPEIETRCYEILDTWLSDVPNNLRPVP